MTDTDWRQRAACSRENLPDQWFPKNDTGTGWEAVIDQAKAVCRRCPATTQCLTWALEHNITDGIWGGYTERERRRLQRANTRPKTGAPA